MTCHGEDGGGEMRNCVNCKEMDTWLYLLSTITNMQFSSPTQHLEAMSIFLKNKRKNKNKKTKQNKTSVWLIYSQALQDVRIPRICMLS